MAVNTKAYTELMAVLQPQDVQLVAVSKTKPVADIADLYALGQRDFGENYVQELVEKVGQLSTDIRWHFIGHLQTNKVKYIIPFTYLIHGVDSVKLLKEIDKQAGKLGKIQAVLLQVHIAQEETKFGLDAQELTALLSQDIHQIYPNVLIKGLMGMASFTTDKTIVRREFANLKLLYNQLALISGSAVRPEILSMGMSGDYTIAIEEGSNLVRIGSLLFGVRNYH